MYTVNEMNSRKRKTVTYLFLSLVLWTSIMSFWNLCAIFFNASTFKILHSFPNFVLNRISYVWFDLRFMNFSLITMVALWKYWLVLPLLWRVFHWFWPSSCLTRHQAANTCLISSRWSWDVLFVWTQWRRRLLPPVDMYSAKLASLVPSEYRRDAQPAERSCLKVTFTGYTCQDQLHDVNLLSSNFIQVHPLSWYTGSILSWNIVKGTKCRLSTPLLYTWRILVPSGRCNSWMESFPRLWFL